MTEAPDAQVRIKLLGLFGILMGGRDIQLRGRKAQGILAYLATQQAHNATREQIAELFWGDRGDEQARSSLRQAIAEIRSALGNQTPIITSRDYIGFAPNAVTTDIEAILGFAGSRDISQLARSLEHADGAFLASLTGIATSFDDWCTIERIKQHDYLVSVTLEAVSDMFDSCKQSDLLAVLRVLDRLDPLNESIARLWMRAAHSTGDAASLHRRYRRLADGLTSEFGTQPSAETRNLFHTLTAITSSVPTVHKADEYPSESAIVTMPPIIIISPLTYAQHDEVGRDIASICTDDVRTALAKYGTIRVVALEALDMDRIVSVCANSLGAYMLSGRITRVGDSIRINLQIGSVTSNVIVWSEQLRLPSKSLGDLIDHIVAKAVGAVMPVVDRDLADRLEGQDEKTNLLVRYAKARGQIRKAKTLSAAQEGVKMLHAILDDDDSHIGARKLLAQMYNTDFWQQMAGHDVAAYRAEAYRLINDAVALKPDDVHLRIRQAWCHLRSGEWRLAERGLTSAVEQLPFDADITNECAFAFCHLGELANAEILMRRAFILNPFPPTDYHADLAAILALQGCTVEAEDHFEVSAESGLQYLAFRICNIQRMEAPGEHRKFLITRFTRAFNAAWQQNRKPGIGDVLDWVAYTMPLKRSEHATFMRDGMVAALSASYPA